MLRLFIQILFQVLTAIIVVDALVSFILSPYQPFRQFLDRIVNPLLAPIRKVIPPVMNMDFSPIILLLILQGLEYLLLKIVP